MALKQFLTTANRCESLIGTPSCVFHFKSLSQADLVANWTVATPSKLGWEREIEQDKFSAGFQGTEGVMERGGAEET